MPNEKLSSEGFDLDAIPASNNGNKDDDVVYEIGGAVTTTASKEANTTEEKASPVTKSEELKRKGNEQFKAGNYLDAYDYYTDAMEACPGLKGSEILELREKHDDGEREKACQRNRLESHRRTRIDGKESNDSSTKKPSGKDNDDDNEEKYVPCEFILPHHDFGNFLSVYHSNRAACLLHLGRYEESIKDCDVAILLNPKYTKAYVRRMMAYEKVERTEDALKDAKMAQENDPQNRDVRNHVRRLEKIEHERIENLKEETMGKLKDLGNSILGNFGMSLDNFKTEKDPNTGSYSISFQN